MMSEKRFIWKCDDENCQIYDTKKKKVYFNVEVVDLLNEQQTTIERLERKLELKTEEVEYLNQMMENGEWLKMNDKDIKEMFELENMLKAKANLNLLEQALLHSDDENRIIIVETNDRQYEISSVEVRQQVNILNDIETVIVIKVI